MKEDVIGMALRDYMNGDKQASIKVLSRDFDDDEIPVSYLFRNYEQMPKIEQIALQRSIGKVLDVGCGAGSHALHLQRTENLNVVAIDTSAEAVKVAQQRGVSKALHENFFDHRGVYDTILMLMNGTGFIGNLKNTEAFFVHLNQLLAANGQVLIDSSDLIYLFENEAGEFWIDAAQGYYGEMQYHMAYKTAQTALFDWLYLDYNTLQNAANSHGFDCELICEGTHYDYLARLSLRN